MDNHLIISNSCSSLYELLFVQYLFLTFLFSLQFSLRVQSYFNSNKFLIGSFRKSEQTSHVSMLAERTDAGIANHTCLSRNSVKYRDSLFGVELFAQFAGMILRVFRERERVDVCRVRDSM